MLAVCFRWVGRRIFFARDQPAFVRGRNDREVADRPGEAVAFRGTTSTATAYGQGKVARCAGPSWTHTYAADDREQLARS